MPYGYPDRFGGYIYWHSGYFGGEPVQLTQPTQLLSVLTLVPCQSCEMHVEYGIYASGPDGLPTTLIAGTGWATLADSPTYTVPLTTTPIVPSGRYWIMNRHLEDLADTTNADYSGLSTLVAYRTLDSSQPIPGAFGASITYTRGPWNDAILGIPIPAPGDVVLAAGVGAALRRGRRRN